MVSERFLLQIRFYHSTKPGISLLTVAGVDERIIKKIVGHAGKGVTENVYTHIEMQVLIEAINKI